MTDEKYYTPTIEEFHVGFEFEQYVDLGDFYGWDAYTIDNGCQIDDALGPSFEPRVKYLDEEDIKELGCREGWNSKGMFIYYVPENSYPAQTEIAKATFGDMVPYGAYIAMKTAQNNVVPWPASQPDMLSEDWMIID